MLSPDQLHEGRTSGEQRGSCRHAGKADLPRLVVDVLAGKPRLLMSISSLASSRSHFAR